MCFFGHRKSKKNFFSEEKKQKTFNFWGRCKLARGGRSALLVGTAGGATQEWQTSLPSVAARDLRDDLSFGATARCGALVSSWWTFLSRLR
jgi:hypothetical protein